MKIYSKILFYMVAVVYLVSLVTSSALPIPIGNQWQLIDSDFEKKKKLIGINWFYSIINQYRLALGMLKKKMKLIFPGRWSEFDSPLPDSASPGSQSLGRGPADIRQTRLQSRCESLVFLCPFILFAKQTPSWCVKTLNASRHSSGRQILTLKEEGKIICNFFSLFPLLLANEP